MIIKSYEIGKINFLKNNFYLFYGENEGFKNQIIKNQLEKKFNNKIFRYEESEILTNKDSFFEKIYTKSFFEDQKLIIISRSTDKIKNVIESIIEKKISDIIIVLNSSILDKKSKLRSYFEKGKNTICIPFYADNTKTLNDQISIFFKDKNIPISQESINLISSRCNGDRQNLKNELDKIENYLKNKTRISVDEIIKLTNLAENYSVSELIDNCLAKNQKKTVNILNENNYSIDDCVLIVRTLLAKSKRIHEIKMQENLSKNIDSVISSYKPPIFWKDKEIVKQQAMLWSEKNIKNLIYETNNIELLIKKNSANSLNILSDFIITQTN
tara:strand:- start:2145 stop:3128 length:984 start_codon:yes stop_codon:yes gene_type:complete